MKLLLKILLIVNIAILATGIYLKSTNAPKGDFTIGIGVLILSFVLMPLFVYHGYKGKDLTKYSFKNMQEPDDDATKN